MAKQTLNNLESRLVIREKINGNFDELYSSQPIISATKPLNPSINTEWLNPATRKKAFWNGTYWLDSAAGTICSSFTFLANNDVFPVQANNWCGEGGAYLGLFVEQLIFSYRLTSGGSPASYNADNKYVFTLNFAGPRAQTPPSLNYTFTIDGIENSVITEYQHIIIPVNQFQTRLGLATLVAAATKTGVPDNLDASYQIIIRGVL